jgi:hypothetical protein
MQRDVAAAIEVKLPGLFAAKAKTEKSASRQKPNRADDAVSLQPLGIRIVKLHDKLVGVVHGTLKDVIHGS